MESFPQLHVVIGLGDGSILDGLDPQHTFILTLPHEPEPNGFVHWPLDDFTVAVSYYFSHHNRIVQLAGAYFHDSHPVSDEEARERHLKDFYEALCMLPFTLGDTCIDGIQGLFHIAKNRRTYQYAPTPRQWWRASCPVIAVGAGPSLANHIEQLKALQDRCLIVACDAAADGLIDEGIQPHIISCHERVPLIGQVLKRRHYDAICGALPVVVPDVVSRFDRHLLIPNTDLPYLWMGIPSEELFYCGRSSGTQAAAIAAAITTGPIYLVGHDLRFRGTQSHWGSSTAVRLGQDESFEIEGYQGPVRSQHWWDLFRKDIGAILTGKTAYNCCADGAVVPGVEVGDLPDPALLPTIEPPAVIPMAKAWFRNDQFTRIPKDAARGLENIERAKSFGHLSADRLFPKQTADIFAYVLRSVYGQHSMDIRQGKLLSPEPLRESLRNVIGGSLGMFWEMCQ